jgi:phosphomethylpyrimidine synthase
MTHMEKATNKIISQEIQRVSRREGVEASFILSGLSRGNIVIPANPRHKGLDPCGIGQGLATKVNVNLGTSQGISDTKGELQKLAATLKYGADTVMDLSTGEDISEVRHAILSSSPLPVGTVPVYEAGIRARQKYGAVVEMNSEELFEVIEEQAEEGVDFMTVHCGVNQRMLSLLKKQKRLTGVVSRGGSFHLGCMIHQGKENPLYEEFDRLLGIARRYDVTLSLGDGFRPGSIADATDLPQIEELVTLGELTQRAWKEGVQIIIEGPGHLPLDQVVMNVKLEKKLCRGAPFYVLGPLVTDIAAGYDHITGAIGGAIAAAAGTDFLCYVTPAEHLSLPDVEDVKQGIIAFRIAAHAGDIVKGIKGAKEWDDKMSEARENLDFEKQINLCLDPENARAVHLRFPSGATCSMCGPYCAIAMVKEYLSKVNVPSRK